MNAYFNNERIISRNTGRICRRTNKIGTVDSPIFLSYVLYILKTLFAVLASENVLMTIRVIFSLGCLAALFATVHALEIGTLSFLPALLIAVCLLAAVAFCFGKGSHNND